MFTDDLHYFPPRDRCIFCSSSPFLGDRSRRRHFNGRTILNTPRCKYASLLFFTSCSLALGFAISPYTVGLRSYDTTLDIFNISSIAPLILRLSPFLSCLYSFFWCEPFFPSSRPISEKRLRRTFLLRCVSFFFFLFASPRLPFF